MKKIWSYLAVGFAFFSAGLVTMYKLMGDQIEINIKKIKTKRGSSEVNVPITVEKPPRRAKKRIKRRRNGRAGTEADS